MSKVPAQQQQIQYEQCACNYFQAAAIQLNIRYSVGVAFPPTDNNLNRVVSLWYQTLAQLGGHGQVALAKVPGQDKARPILIRQPVKASSPGEQVKLNFAQPIIHPRNGRSLSHLIEDNLYGDDPTLFPSTGPAKLVVFVEGDGASASAVVINLNAALWDAVTIKLITESFLSSLQHLQSISNVDVEKNVNKPVYQQMGGWVKILYDSLPESPPEPKFLAIGEDDDDNIPRLSITNILKAERPVKNLKHRRLSITIDAETVGKCRTYLESQQLTLSNWGMACMNHCLCDIYFSKDDSSNKATIAQVLQIDPRTTLLPKGSPTNYIHAIGVIGHGRTFDKLADYQECADGDHGVVEAWLLKEAGRIQSDIQNRLERGEGAYKTLQVVTGQRDNPDEKPKATAVEFVDHGVYDTSNPSYQIDLGHRFDLCELMSIVSHLEQGSGQLKLEIQIGKDQDRETTATLFEKVVALWKDLSANH